MIAYIRAALTRDVRALRRELEAYPGDAEIWTIPAGAPNAAGTLALHVCGNLRHFLGARLGGTSYRRDRDAEFSRRDVPRSELLAEAERTEADVDAALATITAAQLEETFPDPLGGVRLTVGDVLVHLVAHTAYHLGQMDYHRRIVTGVNRPIGAMAPAELASAAKV